MRRFAIAAVLLVTSSLPALPDIAETCFQAPDRDCLLREAARLAREAEREGLSGSLAVDIARRLAEDGQVDLALEIAEAAVDPFTRSWAVATVAWEQAEAGNSQGARTTAARIPDEGRRASALAGIVRTLVERGALDDARSTYALIDTTTTHPNDWGLAALELAEALAATGNASEAFALVGRIEDAASRAWLLRSIADVQAEAGDAAGAEASRLASLEAAATIADPLERARESVETLIVFGRLHEALSVVEEMPADGRRDNLRIEVVNAFAEAGDVEALLAWLPKIESPISRVWVLGALGTVLAERGDRDGAEHILELALNEAERIEGNDFYRNNLVWMVALFWKEAGFLDEALAITHRFPTPAPNLAFLLVLARDQAGDGDCERAHATVSDILSAVNASSHDDSVETSAALVQLANLLETCGDEEGASHLWARAAAAARELSDLDRRDHAIGELVSDLIADGRLDDGIALWVDLHDPIARAVSLTELAEAQAAAGNLPRALELARQIDDPRGGAWALEMIVGLQVRMGDLAGALATTERIDLPLSRGRALMTIAFALPQ